MPAYIDGRGYIRVTVPGFDKTLTSWRGQRLKDLSSEDIQKLCDYFNQAMMLGNYEAVKTWFPGERAKHLVKKLAYKWLEAENKKESTIKIEQRDLETYILPQIGDMAIQEVTRQDFYWIRERWGDIHMARRVRAECQALMTWAWREGITERQVFVPTIKVDKKPTPYIELKDRWGIWELVDDERCRAPLVLSIEMGLRIGEIVALQRDCVDIGRDLLRIVRHVSGTRVIPMRKAGDEYRIPIDMPYSQRAKAVLIERKADIGSPWLFHGVKGNHLQVDRVSKAFKRAARTYGLPQAHLHQCRHSFAQDRVAEGYHLEEVQALLGHGNRGTTEKYKGHGVRHMRKLEVMGGRE